MSNLLQSIKHNKNIARFRFGFRKTRKDKGRKRGSGLKKLGLVAVGSTVLVGGGLLMTRRSNSYPSTSTRGPSQQGIQIENLKEQRAAADAASDALIENLEEATAQRKAQEPISRLRRRKELKSQRTRQLARDYVARKQSFLRNWDIDDQTTRSYAINKLKELQKRDSIQNKWDARAIYNSAPRTSKFGRCPTQK